MIIFSTLIMRLRIVLKVAALTSQGLERDIAMPAPTKLSSSPTIADLESASKIIKDNLQADAGRVPELDVALVAAGGQD